MDERISPSENDDKQGSEQDATDLADSPAEQAKEREREMEESGEENAA